MARATPRGGDAPRAFAARDKLAFLLSLVPYLIDHDRVGVEEAAAHFGVPAQLVREAVELIAVSGVPGETSAYQHEDLFDIDWDAFEERDEIVLTNRVAIDDSPRFSAREAAALIAGLQYLSALPENSDREALGSLMEKLSRGASAAPSSVAVGAGSSGTDAALALVREAVARGVQLEFDYIDASGAREHRRVDPLRVESNDADWYLRGFDHLREGVRTFRLDRMTALELGSAPIEHRPGDVVLPERFFSDGADDLVVTVEVTATALPLVADYLAEGAGRAERDGRVTTQLRVPHFHGLKRLVTSMPGLITVIAPDEARAAVADWAAAGAAQY